MISRLRHYIVAPQKDRHTVLFCFQCRWDENVHSYTKLSPLSLELTWSRTGHSCRTRPVLTESNETGYPSLSTVFVPEMNYQGGYRIQMLSWYKVNTKRALTNKATLGHILLQSTTFVRNAVLLTISSSTVIIAREEYFKLLSNRTKLHRASTIGLLYAKHSRNIIKHPFEINRQTRVSKQKRSEMKTSSEPSVDE